MIVSEERVAVDRVLKWGDRFKFKLAIQIVKISETRLRPPPPPTANRAFPRTPLKKSLAP